MAAFALRVLSLALGAFLVAMGLDKVGWLTDGGAFLAMRFEEWRYSVGPTASWYLETIAIPGTAVFAKLVPIGELTTGLALLAGHRVRLAAAVALFMILNFHVASDVIFQRAYLINGYGPPVVGSLVALILGGAHLPYSLRSGRRRPAPAM